MFANKEKFSDAEGKPSCLPTKRKRMKLTLSFSVTLVSEITSPRVSVQELERPSDRVIKELIVTEKTYVSGLRILTEVTVYQFPNSENLKFASPPPQKLSISGLSEALEGDSQYASRDLASASDRSDLFRLRHPVGSPQHSITRSGEILRWFSHADALSC